MNLKNMLRQIEANGRDRRQIGDRLSHGRRSFRGLLNDNHLGTAPIEPDAGAGAVHTITLTQYRHSSTVQFIGAAVISA
jgi:hypothetical protein